MTNPGIHPFLGVVYHALGGLAAGSFYIPFRRVRGWAWESYWLVGGLASWLLAPCVAALIFCPDVVGVLRDAPRLNLALSYLFGVLWGIGGLTFGLSMRYLGLSLGYALALGCCAAFGTVLPPLFFKQLFPMLSTLSGDVTLVGVLVCLLGIGVCALAGQAKERVLARTELQASLPEFNLRKGLWVAIFAGVMSACMAFAIAAGKPIALKAVERGTPVLWQNTPVFIVILAGGLTTNAVWCLSLNVRHKSGSDYFNGHPLGLNYFWSAVAGITWYLQFFFYGMGTTQMGRYDFSSWSLHMAFIIVTSTVWGLLFREWKGSGSRAHYLVLAGLLVLLLSTLLIGLGNWVAAQSVVRPFQNR
jgi:L-rhamnose-H+ transport protein